MRTFNSTKTSVQSVMWIISGSLWMYSLSKEIFSKFVFKCLHLNSQVSCEWILRAESASLLCACIVTQLCPTLCDLRTVAHQAPLSMGFFLGKDTGVGHRFPPPGDLPNPGIKPISPVSLALQVDFFFFTHWAIREAQLNIYLYKKDLSWPHANRNQLYNDPCSPSLTE